MEFDPYKNPYPNSAKYKQIASWIFLGMVMCVVVSIWAYQRFVPLKLPRNSSDANFYCSVLADTTKLIFTTLNDTDGIQRVGRLRVNLPLDEMIGNNSPSHTEFFVDKMRGTRKRFALYTGIETRRNPAPATSERQVRKVMKNDSLLQEIMMQFEACETRYVSSAIAEPPS